MHCFMVYTLSHLPVFDTVLYMHMDDRCCFMCLPVAGAEVAHP